MKDVVVEMKEPRRYYYCYYTTIPTATPLLLQQLLLQDYMRNGEEGKGHYSTAN